MYQVSGPVIAVGLVLSAVFIPCAFISGITGQFFRQFALTIAVSTLISAFNSLTLSPALTALLLRPQDKTTAPPLPRWAYSILFGWAGYTYATSLLAFLIGQVERVEFLEPLLGPLNFISNQPGWILPVGGISIGFAPAKIGRAHV